MTTRTDREYDDPCVHQVAVFMHNRLGQLREVLQRLEEVQVTVHAVSIVDAVDYAVTRLVTDKIDTARRALKESGFPITETMLLAVEVPDFRAGLLEVTRALLAAEINIHYAYPMFTRPRGHGVVVLHIDSLSSAAKVLERQGFGLLDDRDLEVMG